MTLNPNDPDPPMINNELLISSEDDFLDLETVLSENPDLLGGEDVAELLERLNNTDNIAQSMEDKLDVVLKDLDSILAVFDKGGAPHDDEALKDDEAGPSKDSSQEP